MIFFLASLLASSEASASELWCGGDRIVFYASLEEPVGVEPAGIEVFDCLQNEGKVPAFWEGLGPIIFQDSTGLEAGVVSFENYNMKLWSDHGRWFQAVQFDGEEWRRMKWYEQRLSSDGVILSVGIRRQ